MEEVKKSPDPKIIEKELLSDSWYLLHKYTFEYTSQKGEIVSQVREVYDRGSGAAILLYNIEKHSVILVRQFRLPTWINGNAGGYLIEAVAGLLDGDDPEICARREAEEETGYRIKDIQKVCSMYVSPGAVTEILHCYTAPYAEDMKVNSGGGIEDENIEVLEMDFDEAWAMTGNGMICDAKTILLLQHLRLSGLMDRLKE